jgi:hypothetical protein
MSTDAQSVASSATADTTPVTAIDQAVASDDVAAYRAARAAERSGKPLDVVADSSPADAKPADSSPADAEKHRTDKRATEFRVPELLSERAQLRQRLDQAERELAALKQPQTNDERKAAPSPAAVDVDFPEFDAWLARPENDGKSYLAYQRAFVRHEFDQAQAALHAKDAEVATKHEQDERIAAYHKSAETFVAEHADYWPVVTPITSTPRSSLTDALGDVIQRSANPPALLYKLGTEIETWHRLISLPERLAVYELGKIDAALSPAAKPVSQPLTRAKEPPTILGRKTADPVDAADAAVATGDVAAYRAAKLRARVAAAR